MLKTCLSKGCKNQFEPKVYNQLYCGPECQKKEMSKRNKKIYKPVEKKKETYPKLNCRHCGNVFDLDFNPIHNLDLLQKVICPKCKKYTYEKRN